MYKYDLTNGNKILLGDNVNISKDNVIFSPKRTGGGPRNNILFLEGNLNLGSSIIDFHSDNSIIFLSANKHKYHFNMSIENNSLIYIGRNNYMNNGYFGEPLKIRSAEQKNVFIGNGNMFSWSCWLINSDLHPVYSVETKKRINPSASVLVGDHCWFGQSATILKGVQIGSGSIVGARTLLSGKKIPSNTAWAGNPARQIKDKIFWAQQNIINWTAQDTESHKVDDTEQFTYERDETTLSFDEIDRRLTECKTADDKLNYLLELSNNAAKNRFAI